ncbi:MAG: arginine decarboxylase, pyruvoyl-dependent [Myxococcota bacterium]|jgi:arginine decarboxylase|nr:arginine decarboxylase, pyruvoyl-dependent [Myxococcota bacterium]
MIFKQPSRYFLVSGAAEGFSLLNAFDQALLAAGVGDTNLVRMSSILPPHCTRVEPHPLPYGALVPVAYASHESDKAGEYISAAVAIGVPLDPALPGLIMEHHGAGRRTEIEAYVREMVVQGMNHRNREIKEILSIGVEHRVAAKAAAFAGVVLWDDSVRGAMG